MFGNEEELNLSVIDRCKLSLVQSLYKYSPIFFKIFFDKAYRPARYNAITNEISKYKNINEFRTYIMKNHSYFPLAST